MTHGSLQHPLRMALPAAAALFISLQAEGTAHAQESPADYPEYIEEGTPIPIPYSSGYRGSGVESAYFVVDDDTQVGGNFTGCNLAGTALDSIPVVTSAQIAGTPSPAAFRVKLSNGDLRTPICAALRPAAEENEDRTIVLLGDFGSPASLNPIEVQIVADLSAETLDPTTYSAWNLKGKVIPVTDFSFGPSLVRVERLVGSAIESDTFVPNATLGVSNNGCPSGTDTVLQLHFQSGIRGPGGTTTIPSSMLGQFSVATANAAAISPIGFGDNGDVDNVLELCMDSADQMTSVTVAAATLVDFMGDYNPATSATIALSAQAPTPTLTTDSCDGSTLASWETIAGANSYKLWFRSASAALFSLRYTGPETSMDLAYVEAGTLHVQACNAAGCSPPANAVAVPQNQTTPKQPCDVL